ncbi:hypothetical protein K523DRAFT_319378 [Schizophyllum commune Tattone D]|nr:hypothetical protein K523DRAFT_319378 [Schizophyllum commune Tattone D]
MPGTRGARRVARHTRESLPRRPTPRRALAFAPARRMPARRVPGALPSALRGRRCRALVRPLYHSLPMLIARWRFARHVSVAR